MYEKQYGFRKYHSTIDALINTYDFLIEQNRNKNKVIGIFIDLQKAFDSIDNSILILKKLSYYGINGPYNRLISSYVANRSVYTQIKQVESKQNPIKYGVPQGSVLGPLLFNLYINDIKTFSSNYELDLFADDTCLFVSGKTYSIIERKSSDILKELSSWLKNNRLTLNVNKTHFIDFSKNKSNETLTLKLNNDQITQVKETKYLGLIIQENLKWDSQIKSIINKLNSQIPLYHTLKCIIPKKELTLVYNSLSVSIINYGIELYGKSKNNWYSQLQKTQNRLLKVLFKKPKRYSTKPLNRKLQILKIDDRTDLRRSLLVHRFIHKKRYNKLLI